MKKYILSIALLLVALKTKAQQDTLSQLHQPYQTAMELLTNLQSTTPKDSVVINNEWERLNTKYKLLSDSLQQHSNAQAAINFEVQRLIDAINYRNNDVQINEHLNALYSYAAQHQTELIDDDEQFTKIAQCLMGITPEGETNETKIIQYNASVIQAFYKQLKTTHWTTENHQRFIDFFAGAYLGISSVRKAEKLYRHFDTLYVSTLSRKRENIKPIKTFGLVDSLYLKDGKLMTNGLIWSALTKGKVIIRLSEPRMFDYVYLVSILRTINDKYADAYDVVILRSSENLYDSYLSSIKSNLAFSDYNIATIPADKWSYFTQMPEVLVLNAQNVVTDQATHTNPLFKKLNAPVEAKKEQERTAYWTDIAQKKDSLAQRAMQTKDSTSYRTTHEHITFVLKGLWDDGLTAQLSPVQWSASDTVSDTKKPYLAQFEVWHPQYPVYQLVVLVTGKKQKVTITSGFNNQKEISFAKAKNGKFHQAMQDVNRFVSQSFDSKYIIENYPFQNTVFIEALTQKQQANQAELKATVKGIKKRKVRKMLKLYKAQQIKNAKEMM
jgi:hypothetical protein